jgi:hypothetical protein
MKRRDETAARRTLADNEPETELIRSGVLTRAEAGISKRLARPIGQRLRQLVFGRGIQTGR